MLLEGTTGIGRRGYDLCWLGKDEIRSLCWGKLIQDASYISQTILTLPSDLYGSGDRRYYPCTP